MKFLAFSHLSFKDTLQQLQRFYQGKIVGNTVEFDNDFAEGHVTVREIDEGLQLRAWDMSVNDKIEVQLDAYEFVKPIVFTVYYFLSASVYYGTPTEEEKCKPAYRIQSILVVSNEAPACMNLFPGVFRCLALSFTENWLWQQSAELRERVMELIHGSAQVKRGRVGFELFSMKEFSTLYEVFDRVREANAGLFIKARAFALIDEMLTNRNSARTTIPTDAFYNEVLRQVEKRLGNTVVGKLPKLKSLSREFNISESTLKRKFRVQFGVTIYRYYLAQKMEKARVLLIDERKAIAEVAYLLGYENVSHFIEMFKKHHGQSPGRMRGDETT